MFKLNIELPEECNEIVLDFQHQIRKEKNGKQYSKQQTIYAIIREHPKLVDELQSLKAQLAARTP